MLKVERGPELTKNNSKPESIKVIRKADYVQKELVGELLKELSDSNHKRIVKAYQGEDPLRSMESELGKILLEILNRED